MNLGRHINKLNFFWHFILHLRFKFEPIRFINRFVVGKFGFQAAIFAAIFKNSILIVWHFITSLQFKFEPNMFIYGVAIGTFSCGSPSWMPFQKIYFNCWHYIQCVQSKFEPNWFISGLIIGKFSF